MSAAVLTPDQARRLGVMLKAFESGQLGGRAAMGPRRRFVTSYGQALIPALIASNTAIDTGPDHYWEYVCNGAELSNSTKRMTALSPSTSYSPCYNPAETPNDGSGVEGVGVEIGSVTGATVTMDPLNTGMGVYLLPQVDDAGEPWYAILCGPPNPLVVECV